MRLASRIICLIVIVSFTLFALEQTSSASTHQQNEINEAAPGTPPPRRRAPCPRARAPCTKRSTKPHPRSPRPSPGVTAGSAQPMGHPRCPPRWRCSSTASAWASSRARSACACSPRCATLGDPTDWASHPPGPSPYFTDRRCRARCGSRRRSRSTRPPGFRAAPTRRSPARRGSARAGTRGWPRTSGTSA